MGYEFDDNGKYLGWSNLFDYSSIDTLRASEYLPIPEGVKYVKSDTGFDISDYISKIASKTTKVEKIRAEADLLRVLQDKPITYSKGKQYQYITWTVDDNIAQDIVNDLQSHQDTEITPNMIQRCLKNSVSSSISNIIQNLRNMDQAYSPIAMSSIRKASEQSPKGSKSERMTLMNPLTKFLMQEQNMVGKGVIGITAVGEKVFFNTSHYWNEGLITGDPIRLRNMYFNQTFNRIQGRSTGNMQSLTKNTIANINFENNEQLRLYFNAASDIDAELRAKYNITDADIENKTETWQAYNKELIEAVRNIQENGIYADDLISQLLSAATDNAKELILAKINAGTNLAKCYLHLIMMGFSINDIVSFMTSPVVSIANDLNNVNMFDEYLYKTNMNKVIRWMRGHIPYKQFLSGTSKVLDEEYGNYVSQALYNQAFAALNAKVSKALHDAGYGMETQTITKKMKNEEGAETEISESKLVPKEYNFDELLKDFFFAKISGEIDQELFDFLDTSQQATKSKLNNGIMALSDFIENLVDKVKDSGLTESDYIADLEEFEHVYNLATETSELGSTLLGFNQGIPTSIEELIALNIRINKIVHNKEMMFAISAKQFENEDYFNNLVQTLKDRNSKYSEEEIRTILTTAKDLGIVNTFSFQKWLNNQNGYRKATSDYYNLIKGTWNVFDIIDKLPHFKSIFDILKAVYTFEQTCIKKTALVENLTAKLFDDYDVIDDLKIKKLIDYVDDVLILKFLNEQQFKYPIFKDDKIIDFNWDDQTVTSEFDHIVVDSEYSRGSFKRLIEEKLFSELKQGYYSDVVDGKVVKKEFPMDNKFIRNLVFDLNNENQRFLRLNLDMQNVVSTAENEGKYQECLSDFIKLQNYELGGRPLSDWFMLYNLVVNKNKFGSDRLTTLFGNFLGIIKNDSIIKSFMKYVGDLDFVDAKMPESIAELEEWGFNMDDARYKIAPVISETQEGSHNEDIVREYINGRIMYKRKYKGQYRSPKDLVPDVDYYADQKENDAIKYNRIQNYNDYGCIKTPFANLKINAIAGLRSNDVAQIVGILNNLIKRGLIIINTENC